MIPLRLSLSGFLSYRDRAELDLPASSWPALPEQTGLEILAARRITWALFGQARKRQFAHQRPVQRGGGQRPLPTRNIYRQRTAAGKTTQLELQIFQRDQAGGDAQ
jgi:hypothetical protein